MQRREARKARRSLRGSAAAQLQGPDRERRRGKQTAHTQTRTAHTRSQLEWVAGGSMCGVGLRNQPQGDELRWARLHPLPQHLLGPERSFLPVALLCLGQFAPPSRHRWTRSVPVRLGRAILFGCQLLARGLAKTTAMTVRHAQAHARCARLGRHSTIFRPAAASGIFLQHTLTAARCAERQPTSRHQDPRIWGSYNAEPIDV